MPHFNGARTALRAKCALTRRQMIIVDCLNILIPPCNCKTFELSWSASNYARFWCGGSLCVCFQLLSVCGQQQMITFVFDLEFRLERLWEEWSLPRWEQFCFLGNIEVLALSKAHALRRIHWSVHACSNMAMLVSLMKARLSADVQILGSMAVDQAIVEQFAKIQFALLHAGYVGFGFCNLVSSLASILICPSPVCFGTLQLWI